MRKGHPGKMFPAHFPKPDFATGDGLFGERILIALRRNVRSGRGARV
ncbi:MAG TPA: hypothetical protein GXZ24_02650 [Firmicutes bacterium]|jgi:hypothetical protein|nr:hypothetical protein [Bacillota bacterium]